MRLHRFYMKNPIDKEDFDIGDKEIVHQWKHVFRYNVGSQVILFDGGEYEYLAMLSSLRNLGATVKILRKKKVDVIPRRNVWLCLALLKKDNFELVAQKTTELGVSHIVPILAEHSDKRKINIARLEKIVIEASEQSGRGSVPQILPMTTISDVFASGQLPQNKITFHTSTFTNSDAKAKTANTSIPIQYREYIQNIPEFGSFAIFIGPEGGWIDKELEVFKSYNVPLVSLGPQILRAETAAIAATSLLII
jgi:16S rRNA (uracil1498-N3)-methyltransferase